MCAAYDPLILQQIDTPLSELQLNDLIKMLDKDGDGEVDLKLVVKGTNKIIRSYFLSTITEQSQCQIFTWGARRDLLILSVLTYIVIDNN